MSTICTDNYCTDREGLEKFMKDVLKPSRYTHSLGVEEMASKLAEVHGADVSRAKFAGRFHDIAKGFDNAKMNELINKYALPMTLWDDNALAHSKVGAAILNHEFGVTDDEILNAVRSHTTGRAGMSLLEEIVYVADAIEDNRNYPGLKELQKQALEDLDGACLFIMDYTVDQIKSKGRVPDSDTIEARKYIINRISNKYKEN